MQENLKFKNFVQNLFKRYIHDSVHVSLAFTSLTANWFLYYAIPFSKYLLIFVALITLVGYNVIKNFHLLFRAFSSISIFTKYITIISAIIAGFLIITFNIKANLLILFCCLLSYWYILPFQKWKLRNFYFLKVLSVCAVWALMSVILPSFKLFGQVQSSDYLLFAQNFVFTFSSLLIFEMYDAKDDFNQIKTIATQIGIFSTKIITFLSIIAFALLSIFTNGINAGELFTAIALFCSLLFVTNTKTPYFTWFWVESIPIFWFVINIVIQKL